MLRIQSSTLSVLTVLASVAWLPACGPSAAPGDEPTSSILIEVALADHIDIDEVFWKVSGNDMEQMTGLIDTSAPSSTASVELFGIPDGSDYLVEMEALTTQGDFYCIGGASFDVEAEVATPVELTLHCTRECHFLFCPDLEGECERVDLPDGTSCANGTGFCVAGACERPGS